MPLLINTLSNANIYIDGIGFTGEASEIEVPHPKQTLVEYKGLGMNGRVKVRTGSDVLEAKIKWASFDPVALGLAAMASTASLFQARGSLVSNSSAGTLAELPVVYLFTGTFHDGGKAPFKQQELVEVETSINVTHSELYVAGVQVFMYDAFANLYVVNGIDQLAMFRTNTGG